MGQPRRIDQPFKNSSRDALLRGKGHARFRHNETRSAGGAGMRLPDWRNAPAQHAAVAYAGIELDGCGETGRTPDICLTRECQGRIMMVQPV